jgi:hypothetical protein
MRSTTIVSRRLARGLRVCPASRVLSTEVHDLEELLRELDEESDAGGAPSARPRRGDARRDDPPTTRRRPTRRMPMGSEELDLGLTGFSSSGSGLQKKLRLPTEQTEAQRANRRRSRARRRGGHESRIHGQLRRIFQSGALNASGAFAWEDRPIEVVEVEIREGRGDCIVTWAPPIGASVFGFGDGGSGGLQLGGDGGDDGSAAGWDAAATKAASDALARASNHIAALLRRSLRMKTVPRLAFQLLDDVALDADEAEELSPTPPAVAAVASRGSADADESVEDLLARLEDELEGFELEESEESEDGVARRF